jgi:hypothetical protein
MALSLALDEFKDKLQQEEDRRKLETEALLKKRHSLQMQCKDIQIQCALLKAELRTKKQTLRIMCPDGLESTVRNVVASIPLDKRLKMLDDALRHVEMTTTTSTHDGRVTRRQIMTPTHDWTSAATSSEKGTEDDCCVTGELTLEQRNRYGFANAVVIQ